MKKVTRIAALAAAFCMFCTSGLAAKSTATPTPAPVAIETSVLVPPAEIQTVLDIAWNEWNTLAGKSLPKCNKFTEWRGKGISFGWCGGYVTWCMLQAGIPMEQLALIEEGPVDGIVHVKEASVGKLLRGYQKYGRSTRVPQPGFLLVYGESYNKTIHVGLVYDVQELGGGKYRLTTLEGNMSNRVKMYVHDYDMYAENWQKNLAPVPKDERTQEETSWFNYKLQGDKWYVNCFLMPWVPDGMSEHAADAAVPDAVTDLFIETPPPQTETPVPATPVPVTQAPATDIPVTEAPVTPTPAPATEVPVTEEPFMSFHAPSK